MKNTAIQALEELHAARAAKEISDEIDSEIMFDMLVQIGWTRVHLNRPPRPIARDINTWMHTECKHLWKHRGRQWIFENQDEAAMFKLTWS
jgi:hypothetical protein